MITIIIIFGVLTSLTGIVLLINPELVFRGLRKNHAKSQLHIFAVVIRLILGAFLIYQSDSSKYPVSISFIGWLSVIAAAVFAVMGRANFLRLMGWALSQEKFYSRFGGIAATLFGVFLVYAFM